MERNQAFDPPEYMDWQPDAEILAAYGERLKADPVRRALLDALSLDALLRMYAGMLRFRLHDYALKRWVRQGVISKAWLGTGEEAVTIGNVHALDRMNDVVAPMIRNAGACHEMGMSLEAMLLGYLGTANAPNGGFDGHVGDPAHNVIAPISPVGEMVPVTAGIALAFKRRGEARVAMTWIGDGAAKNGLVHEGVNLAAVMGVPAIFVIQNNQVALGTRLDQHQAGDFRAWGAMYGMPLLEADGNNVLDVYAATRIAVDRARSGGGPSFLLVNTFRMGGHATHDEAEARRTFAPVLFEYWGRRDPIGLYEAYLVTTAGASRDMLRQIEATVTSEVDAAAARALESRTTHLPEGRLAELSGFSAGVRQPGLVARGIVAAG